MSEWQIDERQLAQVNDLLQRADIVSVQNLLTRTAQESALFPLMPYISMSFNEVYYRLPDLLRESMEHIPPEECGNRARETSTGFLQLRNWGIYNFYAYGRRALIQLGLLTPSDNLEDLWLVTDWWTRFMSAFRRESAQPWSLDGNDTAPQHPERTLQVFEADAIACDGNPELRRAIGKFLATASQHALMTHCESRLGMQSSGPYSLGGTTLLHTRDFTNLAQCDFSWMDEAGKDVPYNNLTLTVITKDMGLDVTDWGSAYTSPEDYQSHITGVGLYTSDMLSDRYLPVGMGSPGDLTSTLDDLSAALTDATRVLYQKFASMSARQLIDAGLYVYFGAAIEASRMSGTFRHSDWEYVDERNERLRPIYNEEFGFDVYMDNFAVLLGRQGSANEYYLHPTHYNLWRRGGREAGAPLPHPGRGATPVPTSVLVDHDYSRRVNPRGKVDCRGANSLDAKTAGFRTTRGVLSEAELNQAARDFSSPLHSSPWRYYDDQWVKHHWQTSQAQDLYRYSQEHSRLLAGQGSALLRADLQKLRSEAGEPLWS